MKIQQNVDCGRTMNKSSYQTNYIYIHICRVGGRFGVVGV